MTLFKKVLELRSKQGMLHFTRWAIFQCKWFALHIHKISQPDKDGHCHSHPWNFISIILKGSYEETSLDLNDWPVCSDPTEILTLKKFLTISSMDRWGFHKIKRIVKGTVYSLFFTFGENKSWYYMVNGSMMEHSVYRQFKNEGKL